MHSPFARGTVPLGDAKAVVERFKSRTDYYYYVPHIQTELDHDNCRSHTAPVGSTSEARAQAHGEKPCIQRLARLLLRLWNSTSMSRTSMKIIIIIITMASKTDGIATIVH